MILECAFVWCISVPVPPTMMEQPEQPADPIHTQEFEWTVWDELAECESFHDGRIHWDYGPHSGWGSGIYEGGLQFHPETWDAYRLPGYPDSASDATREQQIVVGEAVLEAQGWKAWPACSRKLGLR